VKTKIDRLYYFVRGHQTPRMAKPHLSKYFLLNLKFILIFKISECPVQSTFSFYLQDNLCNNFYDNSIVYFPLKYCADYIAETSKRHVKLDMTCFRVSELIYPWKRVDKPLHEQLDSWIITRSNILQELYKPAFAKRERILNRHLMVIKILILQLNLSVSACDPALFYAERDLDINFGLIYPNQMTKLNYSLFYSRETFKIQFVSPKSVSDDFLIKIANPIGLNILLVTLITGPTLSLVLSLLSRVRDKAYYRVKSYTPILDLQLIWYFIALTYRAIVDQCASTKHLGKLRFESRVVYVCWLYYSLLIIATYKSGTIHQLMKPPGSKWITTFKELATDPSNMTLIGLGDRAGQTADVRGALIAEYNRSNSHKDKKVFKTILEKYHRPRSAPGKELIQGRVCILDDAFIMQMIPESFEKFYGGSMFGLSSDFVENMEFWSVKKGQVFTVPALHALYNLADSGILEYHRNQQEIADRTIGSHLLGNFVFHNEFLFDEDEDESIMTYWSEQLRRGPVSLKLKHIYVLLLLLAVGLSIGVLSFIIESCVCKTRIKKRRISQRYLKSEENICYITPASLITTSL